MPLLWRQDEGHRCCHGHLPTGPSRRTAGAAAARAAAPIEAADRVVGHSVDHIVKILRQLLFRAPTKAPWAHSTTLLQPFSQKSRTPTVAKEFQIGLYDPAEANLEHFWDSCTAGFFRERLYNSYVVQRKVSYETETYSRSPKNPALQQLQKSSKSASTTPQRPIWNSVVTV